jgi:hypothetical protein
LSSPRIPASLRRSVLAAALGRCAFCRSEEKLMGVTFEVDHIVPRILGGKNSFDNLCLSCPSCNRHKSARTHAVDPTTGAETLLFHPTRDHWSEHFAWSQDGARVLGLTPIGRATIEALKINRSQMLELRRYWLANGNHP